MESTFFTQAQLPSERRCSCQVTDRRIPLLWLSLAVQNSGWVLRPVLTVVVLIATQVNFDVHEKDGSNSAFVVVLGCDLMVSLVPSSVSTEPCCVDGRCRQYCCTGIYPKKLLFWYEADDSGPNSYRCNGHFSFPSTCVRFYEMRVNLFLTQHLVSQVFPIVLFLLLVIGLD